MAPVQVLNSDINLASHTLSMVEATVTYSSSGTVNDLNVISSSPWANADILVRLTATAALTITGMEAGYAGQRVTFISTGTPGGAVFVPESASSASANRFVCFSTNTSGTPMTLGGSAIFQYDGTSQRWRMTAHEQGAWLTPAFNSSNYTASAGTWTLQSGDRTVDSYRLSGRTLHWRNKLDTTSVSNAGVTLFQIIPGGFTSGTNGASTALSRSSDNGAAATLGAITIANGSNFLAYFSTIAAAGYAIAANTTSIDYNISFEVA